MSCRILGIGGFLPGKPLTNSELAKTVNTNEEWIKTRTGILQRYFTEGSVAEMAYEASLRAIADAGIQKDELDLIIVCSTTPDVAFPSTATTLQGMLEVGNIASFDLNAVCTGFIYGMHVARALMETYQYKKILLVGADKMSSLLDMNDRGTAVLFGDGAGAIVLSRQDNNIFDTMVGSDGSYRESLKVKKSPSLNQKIYMNGPEVYKLAVTKMHKMAELICKKNLVKIEDIDFFVPHQANIRIIESIAEKLNLPSNKVITTVSHHANTSAATIPLALDCMKQNKILKRDQLILMSAMGAGVTYGSSIIRY